MGADPCGISRSQRHHDRQGRIQRPRNVHHGEPTSPRCLAPVARERERTAPGQVAQVVSRQLRKRPILPVARHRNVDDIGPDSAYRLQGHTQAFGNARTEALDEYIAARSEAERDLSVPLSFQVQRDEPLVPIRDERLLPDPAGGIAEGRLNLDDLGPVLDLVQRRSTV